MTEHNCPSHCAQCTRCIGVPDRTTCDSCSRTVEPISAIFARIFA